MPFPRAASAALLLSFSAQFIGCRSAELTHKTVRSQQLLSDSATATTPAESNLDELEQSAPAIELITAEKASDPLEPEHLDQPQVLTLGALEQLALEHNPALKQANASVAKAVGFRDQVGLYPNPVAGYNGSQLADRRTDQHTAFVEQDIVTGGKLQKNRLVLEQEVQAQLWQAETTRMRILTDVRIRFYETLAAQERAKLATEFEKVAAQGVEAAQRRLDALEGNRPELLQTRIQQSEVQLLRQRAEIGFAAAWKALFTTVGTPGDAHRELTGRLRVPLENRDWEALYDEFVIVSPEIRTACARVAFAQANLERQKAQPIPNLTFSVAGGYDNGTGSEMINTQVGVPVPLYNRNQGNISAAWAEYCRATQEMQRLKLALRARLVDASRNYDSAAAQVSRYEGEILPAAQEALKLAEEAFRAGEVEFLQILLVRRTYFDSNLQLVQAQMEFAQADAYVNGLLLSGGLTESTDTAVDDGLRGQTLSGQ